MTLKYTARAKDDIDSAFSWYERQRPGLGFEFLDCVEVSIRSIIGFPESYPVTHFCFRRCVIRRFPFSIFFAKEAGAIVVHALFYNRQDPRTLP
jgi:toxin ParE1/3/4